MLLELKNVFFKYENDYILNNISFNINFGELAVIEGKSGSGKSTFLHIAGLIISPQSGNLQFLEKTIIQGKNNFLIRRQIGYIFQSHMLWKDLSVLENVAMPLVLNGMNRRKAYPIAIEWIKQVGLENHINSSVTKISGGEQQRVGIARAFAHNPKLILADEPTGNLDEETGNNIMNLCIAIAKKNNTSIICVTHNKKWHNMFDSEYFFSNQTISTIRKK